MDPSVLKPAVEAVSLAAKLASLFKWGTKKRKVLVKKGRKVVPNARVDVNGKDVGKTDTCGYTSEFSVSLSRIEVTVILGTDIYEATITVAESDHVLIVDLETVNDNIRITVEK